MLQKTLYIRAKGLGGAMMWSLDGDDANASLTKTIATGLWTP
jgi:chitinase